MAKKSFDQRLKDRWLGKQNEKASQTMTDMKKFNKLFTQMRRNISVYFPIKGGKK
ncbi:hypothetical protein LCGC14_1636440 [marine sediment metagenome]|uniref:Uncharacterized protein n=1 Tax=marine sediment metagenome TaxID=412755 RepID=A0A0F9I0Z9_9ZZZZ